jgi:uncharacterized protein (DUF433 family)
VESTLNICKKKHKLPKIKKMSTATLSIGNRIVTDEGILGGQPHIAHRRIRVKDIVQWYDLLKMDADEIAAAYDLELADIFAALAYYYHNRVFLQQIWAQKELLVDELRRSMPSKIKRVVDGSNWL